jgi:hypothetical protein
MEFDDNHKRLIDASKDAIFELRKNPESNSSKYVINDLKNRIG